MMVALTVPRRQVISCLYRKLQTALAALKCSRPVIRSAVARPNLFCFDLVFDGFSRFMQQHDIWITDARSCDKARLMCETRAMQRAIAVCCFFRGSPLHGKQIKPEDVLNPIMPQAFATWELAWNTLDMVSDEFIHRNIFRVLALVDQVYHKPTEVRTYPLRREADGEATNIMARDVTYVTTHQRLAAVAKALFGAQERTTARLSMDIIRSTLRSMQSQFFKARPLRAELAGDGLDDSLFSIVEVPGARPEKVPFVRTSDRIVEINTQALRVGEHTDRKQVV